MGGHDRRGLARTGRRGRPRCPPAGAALEAQPTLEDPEETLAARVDHARLTQDGQQGGGLGDGAFRGRDGAREDLLEVRLALRDLDRPHCRLADHGQDGALDRVHHGCVGRLRAACQGVGQIEPVEVAFALEARGHAPEDLAEDHTGVAARAHERAERERGRHPFHGTLAGGDALGLLQRRADRRGHIRAGVAVGHREHVEGVDLVDMGGDVLDRGCEGAQESLAVAAAPPHGAARSSGCWASGPRPRGTTRSPAT